MIPGNSGVATQFIANGFNMPKFNTVKFNALPHHSPCAVLVTSDCCQPHRLSGFRRHRLLQQPPDPPETSSPISFSGGIVRAHDHQNDNGHTGVSWTNAILRRADTQEPMGRLDASQLGGGPTSNRPPHEYRRIPPVDNHRKDRNGFRHFAQFTFSYEPRSVANIGQMPVVRADDIAWPGSSMVDRNRSSTQQRFHSLVRNALLPAFGIRSKIRVPSFLARSTSRRNARARSTNSSGSS